MGSAAAANTTTSRQQQQPLTSNRPLARLMLVQRFTGLLRVRYL